MAFWKSYGRCVSSREEVDCRFMDIVVRSLEVQYGKRSTVNRIQKSIGREIAGMMIVHFAKALFSRSSVAVLCMSEQRAVYQRHVLTFS